MNQKPCPACLKPSFCSPGEATGYLRFDCSVHGKFEIHERIANYLVKPENTVMRSKLAFEICENRVKSPNAVLKLTQQPMMNPVTR